MRTLEYIADGISETANKLITFLIKHNKKFNVLVLISYFISFLIFGVGFFTINIYTVASVYENASEMTIKVLYLFGLTNALMELFFIGILIYLVLQMKLLIKNLRAK